MATPQCAIAQPGSALAISSNCRRASSYQKSCSNATPRLNGACTALAHETEKLTVPSRSGADVLAGCAASILPMVICATAVREVKANMENARILIANDYRTSEFPLNRVLAGYAGNNSIQRHARVI